MIRVSRPLPLLAALLAGLCLSACSPSKPKQSPQKTAEQTAQQATPQSAAQPSEPATPDSLPAPPDVAHPPASATVLPSGLAYRVLQPGTGTVHPTLDDTVVVDYTGWTTDGKMFDSSVVRGQPATFPLGRLIKGWQQGIPLMVVGEKVRFWIPGKLAYANSHRPGAPKGMLVFDVKLLGINPRK